MRTGRDLLTMIACLALLVGACGGDTSETSSSAADSPAPTAASASREEASLLNIADLLRTDDRFSRFAEIAERAEATVGGLPSTWLRIWDDENIGDDATGVTLFVPTDEAFAALPPEISALLDDPAVEQRHLRTLLGAHYLHYPYPTSEFEPGPHPVFRGEADPVELRLEPLTWGGQAIEETDLGASNGYVHVLSGVVVPDVVAEAAQD